MTTEKVTAMLLQKFDENTKTELQITENDLRKIWPKRSKEQPVFTIRKIVLLWSAPSKYFSGKFHKIHEKTYLMKFFK